MANETYALLWRAVQSDRGVWVLWQRIPAEDDGDGGDWSTVGQVDVIPMRFDAPKETDEERCRPFTPEEALKRARVHAMDAARIRSGDEQDDTLMERIAEEESRTAATFREYAALTAARTRTAKPDEDRRVASSWTDVWYGPDAPDWSKWSREEIADYFFGAGEMTGRANVLAERTRTAKLVERLRGALTGGYRIVGGKVITDALAILDEWERSR